MQKSSSRLFQFCHDRKKLLLLVKSQIRKRDELSSKSRHDHLGGRPAMNMLAESAVLLILKALQGSLPIGTRAVGYKLMWRADISWRNQLQVGTPAHMHT